MATEWSHMTEAYEFAHERLGRLERGDLMEIGEEWMVRLSEKGEPPFDSVRLAQMDDSCLADWIWEQASGYEHGRTCTNGGHELYLCPYGCHTVDLNDMPSDWTPEEY